jgi:hypothetical protein
MSRASKALYTVAWTTLALAMTAILTLTFWAVYPYQGLHDVKVPLPIERPVVETGSLQTYTVEYCVDERLPLPITVSRELEMQTDAGSIFPIAPPVTYLITQRCETRHMSFGIASYIPAGKYHLHYITGLQVNPIRVIRQSFVTEPFEVVEKATTQ